MSVVSADRRFHPSPGRPAPCLLSTRFASARARVVARANSLPRLGQLVACAPSPDRASVGDVNSRLPLVNSSGETGSSFAVPGDGFGPRCLAGCLGHVPAKATRAFLRSQGGNAWTIRVFLQ